MVDGIHGTLPHGDRKPVEWLGELHAGAARTFDFLIDDYIKQAYPALYMLQNDFPRQASFWQRLTNPAGI